MKSFPEIYQNIDIIINLCKYQLLLSMIAETDDLSN